MKETNTNDTEGKFYSYLYEELKRIADRMEETLQKTNEIREVE